MALCDFWVKDRETGRIHKVGSDPHDSIWVDSDGELHYFHLQCGDGCSGKSKLSESGGFEFVPSECGMIEEQER